MCSSDLEEIQNNTSNTQHGQSTIAAILPSSASTPFVLGNGVSDTESDPSIVSPIFVPHYIWTANIHGKNDFPTRRSSDLVQKE